MRLRTKLLAIVLFVGLLPLSVSAWVILGIHERAQARATAALHGAMAVRHAERVSHRLSSVADQLERLARESIQWSSLTQEERQAALWLLYRQDEDIVIATLVDEKNRVVSSPAYVVDDNASEAPGHTPGSPELAQQLLKHLPGPHPNRDAAVFGKSFQARESRFPVLPIVLVVPGNDHRAAHRVVLLLSLRSLCVALGKTASGVTLSLLDDDLRWACPSPTTTVLSSVDAALRAALSGSDTRTYKPEAGEPRLLTQAETGSGFRVLATQPVREANAAGRRMRRYAFLWIAISIGISLASGWLLSRGILAPVARLVAGAKELASGHLGYRLDMPEKDELGLLGGAFNDMASKLEAREHQVRGWNEELQQRVKERTRAIELYHQRLVYMEKAAVMANLSAGVATEINDPLTGVLGALQLVVTRMRQDPSRAQEVRLLGNAETGAQQIRRLVKRMQDLSQRQPRSQLRPVRVRDLVSGALTAVAHELRVNDVDVVQSYVADVPPVLGNFTQLEQALVQVFSNAITACWRAAHAARSDPCSTAVDSTTTGGNSTADGDERGDAPPGATDPRTVASPTLAGKPTRYRIMVVIQADTQGMVTIAISDNGIGIPKGDLARIFEPFVTLGEPKGTGLGLTVARHIVEEHGGSLSAADARDAGATFHIRLPEAEGV